MGEATILGGGWAPTRQGEGEWVGGVSELEERGGARPTHTSMEAAQPGSQQASEEHTHPRTGLLAKQERGRPARSALPMGIGLQGLGKEEESEPKSATSRRESSAVPNRAGEGEGARSKEACLPDPLGREAFRRGRKDAAVREVERRSATDQKGGEENRAGEDRRRWCGEEDGAPIPASPGLRPATINCSQQESPGKADGDLDRGEEVGEPGDGGLREAEEVLKRGGPSVQRNLHRRRAKIEVRKKGSQEQHHHTRLHLLSTHARPP